MYDELTDPRVDRPAIARALLAAAVKTGDDSATNDGVRAYNLVSTLTDVARDLTNGLQWPDRNFLERHSGAIVTVWDDGPEVEYFFSTLLNPSLAATPEDQEMAWERILEYEATERATDHDAARSDGPWYRSHRAGR